uniref:Nop domain-containing protein n=1 Tax=Octactis speculum TaxID=3111310 RepID=A0A7S2C7I0_9STRA|eukprot:CAMPEP_0185773804 /NCGR_PEP_ID=MMETSP1174-20130828/75153_1 /TAXON_ID=35687 /ORGANISM="Dictyocha speculum, Strain CCMP1381" /LENGTH=494 /DNA_ID=CAMNT_0028460647 /DNA_START=30 /DNA_END=1514 /DNA_ORIENTATION=+
MTTLADSFLEDLDDLEGDSDDEQVDEMAVSDDKDGDEEGGDALDDDDDEEPDLDDMLGNIHDEAGIRSVATLRTSDYFVKHMTAINAALERPPQPITGNVEEDPEYQLVVTCNELVQKIDDEMVNVHKYVVDTYSKKFPELESLVPQRLDYMQVVQTIGNEMDMTMVDLSDILPNAVVISVSMTGSTTSGQPLSESDLSQCMQGCREAVELEEDKMKSLTFVESRMNMVAPNVCALIDTIIAAQLMGLAGGLVMMSKIPSCNLQILGQQKQVLGHGFASVAAMPHTGLIYYSTAVQRAPPYLRMRALKLVAAKVALAARMDLHQKEPSDALGRKLREEVDDKIDKWQEPPKAKTKKSLPAPDNRPAKKRGGKRARKHKEKFGMTEMRKETNRRTFSNFEGEYGDDAMGLDLGMLGKGGGKLRMPQKKESKNAAKIKKRAIQMSSGATNGLSSSLVFTPVQGLELANPTANEAKVSDANKKWFSQSNGFLSAKPM